MPKSIFQPCVRTHGNFSVFRNGSTLFPSVVESRNVVPQTRYIDTFSPPFDWVETTTSFTFSKKQFTKRFFNAVQVVIRNPHSTPLTIGSIYLSAANRASSSTMLSRVTPTIMGVSMAGMVAPAATGPDVASNCRLFDGELVSDWMPISAVPRIDGGTWFGGDLRVYISQAVYGYKQTRFTNPDYPVTYGNETCGMATAGDHATPNDALYYNPQNWPEIGYLRFGTVENGSLIFEAGDSLTRGQKGDGQTPPAQGALGPLIMASTIDPNISPVVFGSNGSKSQYFQKIARELIPIYKPKAALVCCWSPNDGPTRQETAWFEFCDTVETCLRVGVQPILRTPYPCNYSEGALTVWLAIRDRIRQFSADNHFPLADYASVTEDSANPGQWIPSLTADALFSLHPNMAGITAAANEIVNASLALT